MTRARKLALVRALASALAVGLPLAVSAGIGPFTRALGEAPAWIAPAVAATGMLVGAGAFVYFVFRWRPRCPQCRGARARFAWEGRLEYLTCPACGYREPTGCTRES